MAFRKLVPVSVWTSRSANECSLYGLVLLQRRGLAGKQRPPDSFIGKSVENVRAEESGEIKVSLSASGGAQLKSAS